MRRRKHFAQTKQVFPNIVKYLKQGFNNKDFTPHASIPVLPILLTFTATTLQQHGFTVSPAWHQSLTFSGQLKCKVCPALISTRKSDPNFVFIFCVQAACPHWSTSTPSLHWLYPAN